MTPGRAPGCYLTAAPCSLKFAVVTSLELRGDNLSCTSAPATTSNRN